MKRAVIDLHNVEGVGITRRELIQKPLIALAIDMRKLEKEVLSRTRFHRAIQPKGFELPLPSTQGFNATRRNQVSNCRLESKATFIRAEIADATEVWFLNRNILTQQV